MTGDGGNLLLRLSPGMSYIVVQAFLSIKIFVEVGSIENCI